MLCLLLSNIPAYYSNVHKNLNIKTFKTVQNQLVPLVILKQFMKRY